MNKITRYVGVREFQRHLFADYSARVLRAIRLTPSSVPLQDRARLHRVLRQIVREARNT